MQAHQQGRQHTHTPIHDDATSASAAAVLHHYTVAAEVHNMGVGLYRRALRAAASASSSSSDHRDRDREEEGEDEDERDLLAEAAMDLYSQAVDSFVAAAGLVNQTTGGASCSALSHLLFARERARQLCRASSQVKRRGRDGLPQHQRLSPPKTAFLAPSGDGDGDGVLPRRRQERLIRRGIQLRTTGGADLSSAGSLEGHPLRSVAIALTNMGLLLMLPPPPQPAQAQATMGDDTCCTCCHHADATAACAAAALEMNRLAYSLLLAADSSSTAAEAHHRTNAVVDTDHHSATVTTILALTLLNNSACILRDSADSKLGDGGEHDGREGGEEGEARLCLAEALRLGGQALASSTPGMMTGGHHHDDGGGWDEASLLIPELCSVVAHNVGLVHRDKKEHDLAVYNLRLSLGLSSPSGLPHGYSCCLPTRDAPPGGDGGVDPAVETLHRIAEIESERDRPGGALAAYHEALGHLEDRGGSSAAPPPARPGPGPATGPRMMARASTMFRIGRVHHEGLGALDDAAMWYREALRVLRRRGRGRGRRPPPPSPPPAAAVGGEAKRRRRRRRRDVVRDRRHAPPTRGGGEEAEAVVLCFLGRVNHAMGDLREALVAYRSVLRIIATATKNDNDDDDSDSDSTDSSSSDYSEDRPDHPPDHRWHSVEFHPGAVASLLNVVGNLHLRVGDVTEATGAFAEECMVRSCIGIGGGGGFPAATRGTTPTHDGGLPRGGGMDVSSSPLQYSLAMLHPPSAAAA